MGGGSNSNALMHEAMVIFDIVSRDRVSRIPSQRQNIDRSQQVIEFDMMIWTNAQYIRSLSS